MKTSPYLQYYVSIAGTILVLVVYSGVMTYFAVKNIPNIKIIAIESTGTRLITDNKDKVFEKEQQEFIKRFLHFYTNYEADNFEETMGRSTDWMSKEVWSRIEDNFKITKQKIMELKMVQISEITKLEQSDTDNNNFTASIKTRQIYRGSMKSLLGQIQLQVESKQRTDVNPFGWEVTSLKETWSEVK